MVRMMWTGLIVVISGLLVVACGGASSEPTPFPTPSPNVTGTLSGDVTKDLAVAARFSCQNNGATSIFEMVATEGIEQLYFSMPFDGEAGTFTLYGADDNAMMTLGVPLDSLHQVRYRSEEQVGYDLGQGEVVIENVPTAPGEPFTGNMSIDLTNDDGGMVSLVAEFDVDAASYAFDGCES